MRPEFGSLAFMKNPGMVACDYNTRAEMVETRGSQKAGQLVSSRDSEIPCFKKKKKVARY